MSSREKQNLCQKKSDAKRKSIICVRRRLQRAKKAASVVTSSIMATSATISSQQQLEVRSNPSSINNLSSERLIARNYKATPLILLFEKRTWSVSFKLNIIKMSLRMPKFTAAFAKVTGFLSAIYDIKRMLHSKDHLSDVSRVPRDNDPNVA